MTLSRTACDKNGHRASLGRLNLTSESGSAGDLVMVEILPFDFSAGLQVSSSYPF